MKLSIGTLVTGAVWTVGGFGIGQVLRFVSNVIMARLLAPELFGLMVIVNTLSLGVQLFSDFGIGQNIIYSPNANNPGFYNTAWSLQIVRAVILWIVILATAVPLAQFYNYPILAIILPLSSITILCAGFSSISLMLLQKRMQFAKLNAFNIICGIISYAVFVLLAYLDRTVWALVLGGIVGSAVTMVGSYLLLPDLQYRFSISKQYVSEILGFGKWVFISSIVYFLSSNYDRLYFAKAVPLELLGIYGIARGISDLLSSVAANLGWHVVFPFISAHVNIPRENLRRQLFSIRLKFLLLMALGCSLFIAAADLAIAILYDARYHAAGWMLPILAIGAWFSMIASINESTLLGIGMPSYSAIANSVRFVFLILGLPLGIKLAGFVGGIAVLSLIELCRYVSILIGQKRERFAFSAQDLAITLAMFVMTGLFEWLRWALGFGTSFDSLLTHQLNSRAR